MGTHGLSVSPATLKNKQIAAIAAGATDTETITVAAGEYAEWYRFEISPACTTSDDELQAVITLGSQVASLLIAIHNPANHDGGVSVLQLPGDMAARGALGEDIVVTVENLDGSTASKLVDWNLYYRIHKPRPA